MAVGKTPDEPAASFLRVGHEIGHLIRPAIVLHIAIDLHSGSGPYLSERAALFRASFIRQPHDKEEPPAEAPVLLQVAHCDSTQRLASRRLLAQVGGLKGFVAIAVIRDQRDEAVA